MHCASKVIQNEDNPIGACLTSTNAQSFHTRELLLPDEPRAPAFVSGSPDWSLVRFLMTVRVRGLMMWMACIKQLV